MACARFLQFEPTEKLEWRYKKTCASLPPVSEMIKDILRYKQAWNEKKSQLHKKEIKRVKDDMYTEFLLHVQRAEDIGITDQATFKKIVDSTNATSKETVDSTRGKGVKREFQVTSNKGKQIIKKERLETRLSVEDRGGEGSSSESMSREVCVKSTPESSNVSVPLQHSLKEARNLLQGYKHLKMELKKIEKEKRQNYMGLIDVDICVKQCHEILMKDLVSIKKAGQFSTLPRCGQHKGNTYYYPTYKEFYIADSAVQCVVDQHNTMIDEIKKIPDQEEKLKTLFKCATLLLFAILTLHPFADGNGRLARLLCSHGLQIFCSFPTAVYNVYSPSTRDDYLDAIIAGRNKLGDMKDKQVESSPDAAKLACDILEQKPADLCALVIECNWFSWRTLLTKIGIEIQLMDI